MVAKKYHVDVFGIIILLLICSEYLVEAAYRRNGEIFNIGWIWSMPYDIGNTLRAPLGGPLSLILTAGLAIIMFFGMLASFVYYFLGTPPRKYHRNDAIQRYPPYPQRRKRSWNSLSFPHIEGHNGATVMTSDYEKHFNKSMEWNTHQERDEKQGNEDARLRPTYVDSMFFYLPVQDVNCRKLMTCHSHGYLTYVPRMVVTVVQAFLRTNTDIPADYQEAIEIGLKDQGSCGKVYSNCTMNLPTIVQNTAFRMLLGDKFDLGQIPPVPDPVCEDDGDDFEYDEGFENFWADHF